jgi:hypothetical protein
VQVHDRSSRHSALAGRCPTRAQPFAFWAQATAATVALFGGLAGCGQESRSPAEPGSTDGLQDLGLDHVVIESEAA